MKHLLSNLLTIGFFGLFFILGLLYAASANDIYITQSGATLDLDILQDGENNTIGSSTTSSSIIGATTNFDIRQVGDSNVITFDINGANYTGTWAITGNSNNIDFNCDSGGSNSSCGTATANIKQIKELLETRVRPAVAMDGGDITFCSFEKGVVTLQMKGACAGCPSSTATLKMGIENMLRHYIPEVTEVRAAEL